jgi:hypothetical protein
MSGSLRPDERKRLQEALRRDLWELDPRRHFREPSRRCLPCTDAARLKRLEVVASLGDIVRASVVRVE